MITSSALKKLRTDAGLTQKKLAELVGVSQAHIAKIEQGKVDPRLSTVNRILQVLAEGKQKKCKDIMARGVLVAKPIDAVLKVSEVMVRNAISQMPIVDGTEIVGTITEESIIKNLNKNLANAKVKDIMDSPLPTVPEDTSVDAIRSTLERRPGVLVLKKKKIVGIITRSDVLKTIA